MNIIKIRTLFFGCLWIVLFFSVVKTQDLPERPAMQQTQIDIIEPTLTEMPKVICYVQNVQTLSITNTQMAEVPNCIGNLFLALQRIDFGNNKLTSLPPNIGSLRRLETLNINNNLLVGLPHEVGNLTLLEQANMSDNKLTTLPESIGGLIDIRILNLSNNEITKLPLQMKNLTNLVTLDLSNNKLTKAPEFLPYLVNIRVLKLTNNLLSEGEKAAIRQVFKDKPNFQLAL